jgi:hypothetical protein
MTHYKSAMMKVGYISRRFFNQREGMGSKDCADKSNQINGCIKPGVVF